jgi:hypothetical protein
MAKFVECLVNDSLEKSAPSRRKAGQLLSQLVKKRVLLKSQFVGGLNEVLAMASDLVVDIPKIWDYFGELIGAKLDLREGKFLCRTKVASRSCKSCLSKHFSASLKNGVSAKLYVS